MALVAALLGASSGAMGSAMSAVFPKLPSGAMIVLVAASFFTISMIFGPARGVLVRALRRWQLNTKIDRQHLLRGIYEVLEARGQAGAAARTGSPPVSYDELLSLRSWSAGRLWRQIRRAEAEELVHREGGTLRLTPQGFGQAARLVHQHRLWELYLITHADIAPSKVDRDADAIEHVLEPEMIARLERLLQQSQHGVPQSPHPIQMVDAEASSGAGEH
jgi:manganese/zinc/iron transport system permease protein